jgi:hypothetical protein
MQMFNGQIGHPEYLQMVSPRLLKRLGSASFRRAGGFSDGGFAGFTGLRGVAIVLGNLGMVLQLLRMVAVLSYFLLSILHTIWVVLRCTRYFVIPADRE